MKWIEYKKELNCDMPQLELHSPSTEEVWIRTNNPFAGRYGIGSYDYEDASWWYQGCTQGFQVTHWAAIEPPEGLNW